MAATDWEKFVIIYVLLLIHVFVCAEQPCELAKIHVQGENGNKQVLTMKHLKPSQCGACHRGDEALSCGSSVDAAASRFAARAVPRTLDLAPRVTLIFDEILIGCDSLTDEVSVELCARSKQYKKQAASAGNKTGKQQQLTKDLFQQYSKAIVENSLLPFMSHHKDTNLGIAYGVVLMSMGYIDESVEHFNRLIKAKEGQGDTAVLYYARGIAYARKGLLEYGLLALADLSQAVDLDPVRADTYTKRAEIYLALGQYTESLADINKAIEIKPAGRLYFLKGTIEFAFDDLAGAEKDFRQTLTEGGEEYRMDALYYLGLTLYYRGKVRNSIGTFKDAIQQKKDYIEAQTGLGQAYRELGDYKEALKNFNVSLHLDTSHLLTVRLRGSMHYHSGEIQESLDDFNKCLLLDPNNKVCRYMQGLAFSSLGQFYEGIKTQTKVIVYNNWPMMKMSPEFIKAHYLREYSRYLHRHLESPVSSVNPDRDLNGAFRDHWAKLLPFTFREGYQEQPGLQPHIPDVAPSMFMNYRPEVQALVCRARQLGSLTQVSVDGFLPNSRLNLAMGLAVIHIAQVMASVWKDGRTMKNGNEFNWRDMFDIAVQYRRLVDLEQAVFWLDSMPEENVKDGYTNDIHFIKGDTMNVRLMQYFELVFKLVKTMVNHYSGEGIFNYKEFKEDLGKVQSCEDLLNVAKTSLLNQQGFMVSTQVPSMKDKMVRHEGVILSLTGDLNGKLLFAINLATTKTRTTSYHTELDFVFNKLYQEIHMSGVNKTVDIDNILNTILSLVYYFYNLMPLTRGSSVAAYSVAMGLIISLGWEVQGKIPTGKLLDIEAMLSGAPDAFIVVLKQWMNVKRSQKPLSSMIKVKDAFPTVRSVLELLSLGSQPITCTMN